MNRTVKRGLRERRMTSRLVSHGGSAKGRRQHRGKPFHGAEVSQSKTPARSGEALHKRGGDRLCERPVSLLTVTAVFAVNRARYRATILEQGDHCHDGERGVVALPSRDGPESQLLNHHEHPYGTKPARPEARAAQGWMKDAAKTTRMPKISSTIPSDPPIKSLRRATDRRLSAERNGGAFREYSEFRCQRAPARRKRARLRP